MNADELVKAQGVMCNEIYCLFSTLVTELTDLCVKSQTSFDGFKESLSNLAIPDRLIEEFEDKKRRVLIDLTVKAEKAASMFSIIDFVEEALSEIEASLSQLETECGVVIASCQDRRPQKGFSLFNKKEATGTDVPPPTWNHPDYIFNVETMITKLNQVKDISEAAMKCHLEGNTTKSYVSYNKH